MGLLTKGADAAALGSIGASTLEMAINVGRYEIEIKYTLILN